MSLYDMVVVGNTLRDIFDVQTQKYISPNPQNSHQQ